MSIEIRLLAAPGDVAAVNALFGKVWGWATVGAPVDAEGLRALAFADNYVAGAFVDGALAAGSVAFWGRDEHGWLLHSHSTAVLPAMAGRGIGFALKQHQREWTLARGVDRINWTFDPLVRRNAYFNLTRLGAVVEEYHETFYGEMHDAINAGDESDRCVAMWHLDRPPGGGETVANQERVPRVLTAADGDAAPPVVDTAALGAEPVVHAYVPADIEALRRTDPQSARAWRHAARATIGDAIRAGYTAVEMSRDGWYTLVRRDSLA